MYRKEKECIDSGKNILLQQQMKGGIAPFLQLASMSIGTPIEIFASRAATGAPGAGAHANKVAARTGSRAGAQQMAGLA